MQKDPNQRFQTTRAFFSALCAACGFSEGAIADRIAQQFIQQPSPPTLQDPIPRKQGKTSPRIKTVPLTVLGLVLFILLVVGLVSGWFTHGTIRKTSGIISSNTESLTSSNSPSTEVSQEVTIISPTATIIAITATKSYTKELTTISPIDGMTMVYVPAGEFLMGSPEGVGDDDEHPQHIVYLESFYIDQMEVTNTMFSEFVVKTNYQTDAEKAGKSYGFVGNDWLLVSGVNWKHPYGPSSDIGGLDNHPVIHVSWNDAKAYCEWAGKRLPTEAEWEKGARGTSGATYPWGNDPPAGNLVNFADINTNFDWSVNSVDDGYKFTSPVGTYPDGASPYNLLDVSGNVWEWVADWYDKDYYSQSPNRNPQGPVTGTVRVMRGGAWDDLIAGIRTSYRAAYSQTNTNGDTGFRCASSVDNG